MKRTLSVNVPKWALESLFYGGSALLSPRQEKLVDSFLYALSNVKYKTPIDYQNMGQGVSVFDGSICLVYKVVFELK